MVLFREEDIDVARSLLRESHVNLISSYYDWKPDEPRYLRENPELVDQMELIEKNINNDKKSDEELLVMTEQLIDFLEDWFPDDLEPELEVELRETLDLSNASLQEFKKIKEVSNMQTVTTENRINKSIEAILYNLQSGAYNRIAFSKATRQDGYVYSASHVDLDETVIVRTLADRLIVMLWQLDPANEFGDECVTKPVANNGKEHLLKQISYEIMLNDIHCVSDGVTRTFRIF